jgi:hypothetical protein
MNPQPYYKEHEKYLSEKFKDQYEYDKGNICFVIFLIVAIGLIFIVG